MMPEINYWAVLLSTVASMIVGSIWYTPKVFGNRWMTLAKVTPAGTNIGAWLPLVVSVVLSFLLAWVLAGAVTIAWHFYGGSYVSSSIVTAFTLWAGFTAGRIIVHDIFEGRPSNLTVLTIAHELVTVLAMAVVIGVWPPAGTV
ncbi:DUF1761 domain-containing protein [Microbacterium sp.]|uniref:DUF1761 domain-containing protein n=1 Tax=Microbacterium sp. TaxID=51671 RepID=UPI0039E24BEB